MRFLGSIIFLVFTSCSYRAIPTDSSNDLRRDISKPAMSQAPSSAPETVTSSAPEKNLDDSKRGKESKNTSPQKSSVDIPQSMILEEPETDELPGIASTAALPLVAAGSSREQEFLSFTSYNPFEDGEDTFLVNLDAESRNFHYPIDGHLLSPYGSRGRGWHSGADLKGDSGDPIYAAFDGVVRLSRNYGGYGNVIVVRHNNGLETAYSHNSQNLVRVGDKVTAGQKIALCGRTGRATGTHCHFEVRVLGQAINPSLLLDFKNRKLNSGLLIVNRSSANKILASRRSDGNEFADVKPNTSFASNTPSKSSSSSSYNNSSSTTQTKASPSPTAAAGSSAYHTVSKGDTLSGIAKKYNTSVRKICELNNLDEKKYLQLKQKIRIP